jgi:hypothetical protein
MRGKVRSLKRKGPFNMSIKTYSFIRPKSFMLSISLFIMISASMPLSPIFIQILFVWSLTPMEESKTFKKISMKSIWKIKYSLTRKGKQKIKMPLTRNSN